MSQNPCKIVKILNLEMLVSHFKNDTYQSLSSYRNIVSLNCYCLAKCLQIGSKQAENLQFL